jgi:hypothetical protein
MRLSCPYLLHPISTKISLQYHRLTTHTPLIIPSTAGPFLLPHQILPTPPTIQGAVTASITTPYPTPEASISPPPRSSTSPPAAVSLQDKEDLLTPSDSPNLPSPASGLVLDNILPTGPSLTAHSPITRTDLSLSFPESRHPIPAPGEPSASLVQAPEPDPGTAAVDDGSPISSLCKEMNDLDPPVHHAIDANTTPTIVLPPQTPSLPSVTDAAPDGATVRRSQQGLDAERKGDHPHDPSRYHYDMV